MAVRKLKGSWWVDFQYRRERVRRRSPLNTKGGAQEHEIFLRQFMATHGSLDELDPSKDDDTPTLAGFAERWLCEYADVNNGRSERRNKRRSLHSVLLPFFGGLQLDAITVSLVEKFKAALLARGLSPKTVNNHLTILNRCLGTARDWSIITATPRVRLLKTSRPPFKFLTPSEANALLASMEDPTLRAMVRTSVRAGLRYSELRGLYWDDIDFARQQITIQRAFILKQVGPTKNHRTRYVPMTPDLAEELRTLPRTSRFVFDVRAKHSRQLELLKIECELAGVTIVGWHALRHTFASHLMTAGAPIHSVQALLGHSSIEMTMRYSHLTPTVLRSAIDLLEGPNELWATRRQPEPQAPSSALHATQAVEADCGSTKQKDATSR